MVLFLDLRFLEAEYRRDLHFGATVRLSLGRVGPAPHTQHLLEPFAAITQNSSWSFSIVDSLANRQPLSGEGVVSSYSVEATGLVSRHGSEFGTLMATQSCGLETVAQAILGALKSLQRRSKAGHWQHSSFATVC